MPAGALKKTGAMSSGPPHQAEAACAVPASPDARTGLHGQLMAQAGGLANDDLLARMLASQIQGLGALPPGLGLARADFAALMARHFPGYILPAGLADVSVAASRAAEREDLLALLEEHCAGRDDSESWMAGIVTAACMGGDHLWQDLGLWSRVDLSRLMTQNFPVLAARNTRDMKWKKFLYKQLCDREAVQVCRSPSCEVCADYAGCFGPEN
jgi:nitrogen fixation protein NifQ